MRLLPLRQHERDTIRHEARVGIPLDMIADTHRITTAKVLEVADLTLHEHRRRQMVRADICFAWPDLPGRDAVDDLVARRLGEPAR